MNNFNWLNIRSYNNSQNDGFEELICQLARNEEVKGKKKFIRKGNPDAGVECFWTLNTGEEVGWQAKFFTSSLDSSQWGQLDDSVKSVLEKHPNIIKYIIAIPVDPADARIEGQKSMLEKWDERVEKWENWANEKEMVVEFIPWWSSDLITRLQNPINKGLLYFWFNKEEFTDSWFSEQVEKNIADLGKRYTLELNFKLDIAKIFDGLFYDDNFKNQFDEKYDALLKKINKVNEIALKADPLSKKNNELEKLMNDLVSAYERISFLEIDKINYDQILDIINNLKVETKKLKNIIYDAQKELQDKEEKNSFKRSKNKYDSELRYLRELEGNLKEFYYFITSKTAKLSNSPCLILDGEAGVGKSHLLADLAKKQINKGKASILLLGQHFSTEERPWTQILKNILRLSCDEDEFLGALNAKAQAMGSRIVIFIDALNEGKGKYFWPDNISSFIKSFEKYKWVGLVLSIRSSYTELIAPKEKFDYDRVTYLTHFGFSKVEYEASKLFFENYDIEQPAVPLLHPEFKNVL